MWYGALLFLAAIAVWLFGYAIGTSRERAVLSAVQRVLANRSVAVLVNDGEQLRSVDITRLPAGATVLTALEQAAQEKQLTLDVDKSSSMGAFVKQIGDKANGQDGKFWQYYVNGTQPMIAADRLEVKGGEIILWTFSKSEM